MRYGEKEIREFSVEGDLEIWPDKHAKNYKITITLPEFSCLCPRSGYPDYATLILEYMPDQWVVELKVIKLYINTFRDRHISHEESANEIFDVLYGKLQPKWMKLTANFNPRGNVHTLIEIDSDLFQKEQ